MNTNKISVMWCEFIDNGKTLTNFGDILTPYILEKKYNIKSEYSCDNPQLIGIGSLLHTLPDQFNNYIWTTGFLFPTKQISLRIPPSAIRGKLSLQNIINCDTSNTVLGDGGLILDRIYKLLEYAGFKRASHVS